VVVVVMEVFSERSISNYITRIICSRRRFHELQVTEETCFYKILPISYPIEPCQISPVCNIVSVVSEMSKVDAET